MKPVLVFDIETIPDVPGLRRINDLPGELSDDEVAELAFQQRRARTGNDFLQLHLQRVVTISCVLRDAAHFRVFSLSEPDCTEGELIQRFFDGIEKFTPQIVSWNGGGFDLPVLQLEGLNGQARSQRLIVLSQRDARPATWLTIIGSHVEMALWLGMLSLLYLLLPQQWELDWSWSNLIEPDSGSWLWLEHLSNLLYALLLIICIAIGLSATLLMVKNSLL